jgi:hypothetical protein
LRVGEPVAQFYERGLATSHDVRISGKKGDNQNALDERTKNRSRIGTCPPPHFTDADYAESEGERHEKFATNDADTAAYAPAVL